MAGQQILPTLDFRTQAQRQGITSTQQTVQAITGILRELGQAEQTRRERKQLDRIATAIAGGATTIEAINAVAQQPVETGGGFQGILQRLGGAFQPQGGGIQQDIQQMIVGTRLKQALAPKPLLTRPEEREIALHGKRPRPGAAAPAAPTKQQKQRDRDLATIGNENKTEFQKAEARARIDKDPSQPRNPVPSGGTYDEFLSDEDKEKGKFGKKAYTEALKRVEDAARLQGLDHTQVKEDFDRWWDKRVENERTGLLGGAFTRNVTTPRSEFQDILPENISPTQVPSPKIPRGTARNIRQAEKTLDKATAAAILQEAGGDANKAREIARKRGFKF